MRQARIVHVSSVHDPMDDRIFYKECRSLARAGYEVTFVASHGKDEFVDGVRIKAVAQASGRLSRMTVTVGQVCREAVRQAADVYQFHDPELIPVGLLLRILGKKVVYDIHEDLPRDILSKDYLHEWVRRPLAWLVECIENQASRWFSALMPATPSIAERFQRLNSNCVVIHNYPILQELAPPVDVPWSQRDCAVAYVGAAITRSRGIREIVNALDRLPEGLRPRLKLAGSFWPENLREEVTGLAGWKRVDALGFLERPGVADLLKHVRAGLVLLYPEPNYILALPVKMFEYMSAGIPVIASNFPLWRGIIEGAGCGLLVDSMDPEAIAHAIEYVLTHPQEAEAMGRRGRKAVEEQYNWGVEERKLLNCYADLLGSNCLNREEPQEGYVRNSRSRLV